VTPRHGTPRAKIHAGAPDLQWLVVGSREGAWAIPFEVVTRFTNTDQLVMMVVDDAGAPSGKIDVALREVPRHRR
jgi:hypothetical protein